MKMRYGVVLGAEVKIIQKILSQVLLMIKWKFGNGEYLFRYSEPSLQRQHLFPKMLPLKWMCCCKDSLMDRMLYKKDLIEYMFWIHCVSPQWGDSNKYPNHMLLGFNAIFLRNFSLTVTSWAELSWHSNCHYKEFCPCIECRYKEGWLYKSMRGTSPNYIITRLSENVPFRHVLPAVWSESSLGTFWIAKDLGWHN